MVIEIKVPSPGESITEVQLASWIVGNGDYVEKDSDIAEIDSDKATLAISAPRSGIITLLVGQGETIKVGSVIATINTEAARREEAAIGATSATLPDQPLVKPSAEPVQEGAPATTAPEPPIADDLPVIISPLAQKLMSEHKIDKKELTGHFLRISKADVLEYISEKPKPAATPENRLLPRDAERKKLSTLRLKLAQRLVAVKQETAMLTTFNEVDMSRIIGLKNMFGDSFKAKHGVGMGFVSFFAKASAEAMRHYPQVNAMIDGDEMITHSYVDIGIAVSAPKGLVVPVVRNAESLSIAQIEQRIKELAAKARDNKITLEEMTGGTFTITNGGVFGSLLSTPILNPPQSAILGMHNIVDRPVAVNGKVEIRPMMYIALSYDHRVIDGRESVGFLVKVKEMIEDPAKLLFGGNDPIKELLGL